MLWSCERRVQHVDLSDARAMVICIPGNRTINARPGASSLSATPPKRVLTAEQRTLVARCLCEQLSWPGMCRTVDVSSRWLMPFLVTCFAPWPDHLHGLPVMAPQEVIIGRLEVEADEMGSFVANKANKLWGWIAMDTQTRQILACHVGDRSHARAQQLWANLPAVDRERATGYTEQ